MSKLLNSSNGNGNAEQINGTEFKENLQQSFNNLNPNIQRVIVNALSGCRDSQKAYNTYLTEKNKLLRG